MTPKSPLFLYILQSLDWGPLHCGSRWAKAAKNKFPAWCDFMNLLTKFQQIYVYFFYRNVALYTQTVAVFLTAILHRGLRIDFFFIFSTNLLFPISIWTIFPLFFLDFYSPLNSFQIRFIFVLNSFQIRFIFVLNLF